MTIDREPLDDDALDAVTGGTGQGNPDDCGSYSWNGVGDATNTCETCRRSGTTKCPYGK